ncbi:MAG TPA: glycosyltransferase family 39 protein, partial [Vicinamibacteria bacterium]|nr:glycosyltransferase family 39 protein [Vicinamibacteria bacterium]
MFSLRWVTVLAVAFGLGAALLSAGRASETPDEPVHLEWSRRLLLERVTERRSNEYFESKSPVSMLNVAARRLARRVAAGDDEPRRGRVLRFASRLPTVFLFAALLAAVFLAARAWVGPTAAHLATIACALDPSLIAHGSLATVDVAFALFHFLALAAAYALAARPSAARGLILGLALGLAFATKFSAVLLIPGIVLAFLAVRAEAVDAHPWRRATVALLVAAVTTTVTIGAAYLFAGVGTPMADIRWDSAPFAFLAGRWPGLRLPLPADFLTGIDLSLARERTLKWRVVMLGRQYPRGVWYYFALLWLMKTPLLLLAAEVAGYVRAIRTGLLWRSPPLRFLALNLALLLAYFSLLFHAQIGYRFVLMCVPLGYIIAAAGLTSLP